MLENIQECLQPEQSEETGADRFFVVRYDCWKYDYYEEPIVAIISVLRDQIDQYINLLTDDAKRVLLETVKNTITKIAVEAIKAKKEEPTTKNPGKPSPPTNQGGKKKWANMSSEEKKEHWWKNHCTKPGKLPKRCNNKNRPKQR